MWRRARTLTVSESRGDDDSFELSDAESRRTDGEGELMGPRPRETRLAVDDGMNGLDVLERGRARRGARNPERRRAGDRAEIAALRRRRVMPWGRGGRWRGGGRRALALPRRAAVLAPPGGRGGPLTPHLHLTGAAGRDAPSAAAGAARARRPPPQAVREY